MKATDQPADDAAREIVQVLLGQMRHCALAVVDKNGHPSVTRIAGLWHDSRILTLVSDLSSHTKPLRDDGRVSVLIGEPGYRGDPLNLPRMSVQGKAQEVDKTVMAKPWLAAHPKSKLYFDFADFRMFAIDPSGAALNGGFGKAYAITLADMG